MSKHSRVIDPQGNITRGTDGHFYVRNERVAFYYHHGKNGQLLQCNVITPFTTLYGSYIAISWARPHVLDKGKVSRIRGRSIAAARLGKFLDLVQYLDWDIGDAAFTTKNIKVYEVDKSVTTNYNGIIGPDLTIAHNNTQIWDSKNSKYRPVRRESISEYSLVKIWNKLTNRSN